MCRMFGFRSAVPSKAHRSLIDADNALSNQSRLHPDGWGIGWFIDEEAYVVRSANPADDCTRFARASATLRSHTFIVHVRRATVGVIDHLNAHPFRHGRWLFAHNGTVFEFDKIRDWVLERTAPRLRDVILGDTDSEHLFYYLLTALNEAGYDRTGRDRSCENKVAEVIRRSLIELDAEAQRLGLLRPIVNVLLTDGRLMVAHKAGMPLFLSTQKRHCADFATCPAVKVCMERRRPLDVPVNHMLVASEPIGRDENIWEDIADGSTVVLSEDMHLHFVAPPEGWVKPELPEEYRVAPEPTLDL